MRSHERDRIGLIGANGAGKSTLLKMMVTARRAARPDAVPDDGLITWRRDLTLEYVAQEPQLAVAATVGSVRSREGVADHEIQTDGRGAAAAAARRA